MVIVMLIKAIFILVEFILLYVVAFICNKGYRSTEDFLFIGPKQWDAIIMFMLVTIAALLIRF